MNNNITFLYEKNGYKVEKLIVLGLTFFIVTGDKKRFIRKSVRSVKEIVGLH